MNLATSIVVLIAAFSWSMSSMADQARQECRMIRSVQEPLPDSVRAYMQDNSQSAIRMCKRIDFNTESYYALGPITRVGEVCRFTRRQISPQTQDPPAELSYMVRTNATCPMQESPQYIPAHNVSEADFASVAAFLQKLASSEQAFESALADLPDDQQRFEVIADLRHQIAKLGRLPVVRIGKFPGFLDIRSVFEVHIKATDEHRLYVLKVRELFGHLSLIELRAANS